MTNLKSQALKQSRVHVPDVPDLTQTVEVESDYSETLTNAFCGAKNSYFNKKFSKIFFEICLKLIYLNLTSIEFDEIETF